eukprot:2058536-Lingulodinium_polyedra.AAC.1
MSANVVTLTCAMGCHTVLRNSGWSSLNKRTTKDTKLAKYPPSPWRLFWCYASPEGALPTRPGYYPR